MKFIDFCVHDKQLLVCFIMLTCAQFWQQAMAKSDAATPQLPSPAIVLDLAVPEPNLKTTPVETSTFTNPKAENSTSQQLIAQGKKKSAMNLDCGMDVYQTMIDTVSLGSRVTGECDVKYRY